MQFVEATEPSTDTSWQGSCYYNAIEFLVKYDGDYKVCHGIVRGQGAISGNYICHGWVEDDLYCYDHDGKTNNVTKIAKALYYAMGNIDESKVVRYSRQEVFEHVSMTDHAGPWKPELVYHAVNEQGSVYEPV